jgi:type IV secretory pathway VirB2 component (pilin)
MKKLYKNALLLVGVLALFTFFNFALVQGGYAQLPIQTPPQTTALTQGETIGEVIANIFKWVFLILTWIAGALAVIYIIWGGINVIIQGKIDEGKNRLIYGVVGLVIALISFALVKLIETIVVTGGVGE